MWAGVDETDVVLSLKTSQSGDEAHREPEWSSRGRQVTPEADRLVSWLLGQGRVGLRALFFVCMYEHVCV